MRVVAAFLLAAAFASPAAAESGPAVPFTMAVPDDTLADLEARVRATRWPDQIPDSGWDYGADTAYMRELAAYWADGFDWRAQEARINALPNFTAEIDGVDIHFIHAESADPDAVPLLLLHGWPSSVVQFLDIIPLLTDPAAHGAPDAPSFHVVAASLPGYGFSEIPSERGFAVEAIATRLDALMTETLGYERYGVRGSDIGLIIGQAMSQSYAEHIIGLHLTGGLLTIARFPPEPVSEDVATFRAERDAWFDQEFAYGRLHATKPQTIGAALNDSPVGLAAWIVEKFHAWGDTGGDVESRFTKDELLTNVTVYWVTQTINSSMRFYYELNRERRAGGGPSGVSPVPTGYLGASHDMVATPRELIELNLEPEHYAETDVGGHFLEWEEPELVADDLRTFFGSLAE